MDIPLAPVTYGLIVANLAVSIWALFFDRDFTRQFAFDVGAIKRDKQHFRVFTSSFLHVDPMHLAFNMMTLFFFGPDVERALGKLGFLVVYFGAILASGIVSFYVNRHNKAYTSIGASDAVSGVLFSFVLMAPFAKMFIFPLPLPVPAWLFGIIFLLISSVLMGAENRRIAHEGHLGGAVGGLILTLLMVPETVMRYFT